MSGMYFAPQHKGLIVVYDDAMLHDFMIRPSYQIQSFAKKVQCLITVMIECCQR